MEEKENTINNVEKFKNISHYTESGVNENKGDDDDDDENSNNLYKVNIEQFFYYLFFIFIYFS